MFNKSSNIVKIAILALIILVVGGYIYLNMGVRRGIPGIPDPIQTEEEAGNVQMEVDGYNVLINYEYSYEIEALVLHTKNYTPSLSIGDKLAPKDLALGWGVVAEYNDRIDFHWGQSGRWYSWRVSSYEELLPVGGESEVSLHSANNHIIPANPTIKRQLKKIKRGDHIKMKGHLANVYASKGDKSITWNSSTTREDTGNGACELIYVTDIQWLD